MPQTERNLEVMSDAVAHGRGDEDIAAVAEHLPSRLTHLRSTSRIATARRVRRSHRHARERRRDARARPRHVAPGGVQGGGDRRRGIEAGYRLIDTAENYRNEGGVGRAIRTSGIDRDELFVTTKFNKRWHGVEEAQQAFANSAERLGLETIDLS